jgi:excisionase family DNA binding protein
MFTTSAARVSSLPHYLTSPRVRTQRLYWRQAGGTPPHFDASAQPLVVSIAEACALLRVSKWSLYQLIRSGKLETVKIGSRRVVPVSALYELLTKLGNEGNW